MILLRHHHGGHSFLLNNPIASVIADIFIILCMTFVLIGMVAFVYFFIRFVIPDLLEIEAREKEARKNRKNTF